MHRRLVILTVIIVAALGALSGLGHHAISTWAQGLEGVRLGEFAEVAEQIREDVRRKLDDFIEVEEQREYTEYNSLYVPENVVATQQELPLLRSPLSDRYSNGFAYGYFQVEPGGRIVTPYARAEQTQADSTQDQALSQLEHIEWNVGNNLLPFVTSPSGTLTLHEAMAENARRNAGLPAEEGKAQAPVATISNTAKIADNLAIESLQNSRAPQTLTQQRSVYVMNEDQRNQFGRQESLGATAADQSAQMAVPQQPVQSDASQRQRAAQQAQSAAARRQVFQQPDPSDTVQVRVEPFVPIVVPGEGNASSIFGGQVFLLRHVQIEDNHLLQGFLLDETHLVSEVEESAVRLVREGMDFELPQARPPQTAEQAAYTAILDFGFGDLVLNLKEVDPAWIGKRIEGLQRVYIGIIAIVAAAVALALGSLWQNVRAQAQLAQKKDDFISAVSHELRTPLTSIRMYSEMLEKGWVKSAEKLSEYYRSMRAESERLSRLVENVLDFSRIQKGRKKYAFQLGDINACVSDVVAMMRPYAQQHGFAIEADLAALSEIPFDKDAVTQIVVNLIDNAVKYATAAEDKIIRLRTKRQGRYTIIEVEDHGPGIPHRQRKKVFEQFYRYGAGTPSSRSQTTGTGLGLALVKRFAEAHDGFVEICSAQPAGVTLRVGLGVPG